MSISMLQVYDNILTTCGYVVDENGQVRKKLGKALPVSLQVDDHTRYLVLPTKENLKSDKVFDYVFFHPFQENLVRGESRVLSMVRKELNHSYGAAVASLMISLVEVSRGLVAHTDLSVEQHNIIASIGKVDDRFVADFNKIIENLFRRSSKNTPVNLSLRKGIEWNGKVHSRVAIWSSPLYDEVIETINQTNKNKDYSPKILGVPVRKGDLKTYENLCKVFFDGLETKGHYAYGASDATDAPYVEAFVRSLLTLPEHINRIAEVFYAGKTAIYAKEVAKENLVSSTLDISWLKEMEGPFTVQNWRKEYLLIPLQDGNEGAAPVSKEANEANLDAVRKQKWGEVTEEHQGNPSTVRTNVPQPNASHQPHVHQHQSPNQNNHNANNTGSSQFLRNNNVNNGYVYNNHSQPHYQNHQQGHNQFIRQNDYNNGYGNRAGYGYQPPQHSGNVFRNQYENQYGHYNNYGHYAPPPAVHGFVPGNSHTAQTNNGYGYGYGNNNFRSPVMNRGSSIFGFKKNG